MDERNDQPSLIHEASDYTEQVTGILAEHPEYLVFWDEKSLWLWRSGWPEARRHDGFLGLADKNLVKDAYEKEDVEALSKYCSINFRKEDGKRLHGSARADACNFKREIATKHAGPDTENIKKAKAMVDKMAARMTQMLNDIEAAKGDQAKIKEIGEKFRKDSEATKVEGEALNKAMSPDEKKSVETYARGKNGSSDGALHGGDDEESSEVNVEGYGRVRRCLSGCCGHRHRARRATPTRPGIVATASVSDATPTRSGGGGRAIG